MVSSYYHYEKEQARPRSLCGSVYTGCLMVVAGLGVGILLYSTVSITITVPSFMDHHSTSKTSLSSVTQSEEENSVISPFLTALHIESTEANENKLNKETGEEIEEEFLLQHSTHEEHTGNIMLESGVLNNVRFYSCNNFVSLNDGSNYPQPETIIDIVLLQSTSYTIDDWKQSGMLSYFCNTTLASIAPAVRVIALDLPATAKHTVLRDVLSDLVAGLETHPNFPIKIDGLVTPSASGSIVMDWLLASKNAEESSDEDDDYNAQHGSLRTFVNSWIPVASNGLLNIPQSIIEPAVADLPILSIYGNDDIAGKRSSELLAQSTSETKVQELKGRHPVFFDSSKEFVRTVLQYLVQQQQKRIFDRQQ
jgi:hypothetical protein